MRKISANYIFPVSGNPIKDGIIIIDEHGTIVEIIDQKDKFTEISGVEHFNGILVPGFINAHCHLELSHMKGVLSCRGKGLPSFIDEIIKKRFTPPNIEEIIESADREMRLNGIVAVGDISNCADSFDVKQRSSINYTTFIELFTINDTLVEKTFDDGLKNLEILSEKKLKGTIVPHAPYTVPTKLFEKISDFYTKNPNVTSIHNQETESENLMFLNNTGEMFEMLKNIGFDFSCFSFSGKNSIKSYLNYFKSNQNILLIHNTFTELTDLKFAENFSKNIYWVLCPNSNKYIENILPNFPMFVENNSNVCLGTDSYSSNDELNILSEMKTLAKEFPNIKFDKILEAACLNGAKALEISDFYGSFEIGKNPGINLITDFDFETMNLTSTSQIYPLD